MYNQGAIGIYLFNDQYDYVNYFRVMMKKTKQKRH